MSKLKAGSADKNVRWVNYNLDLAEKLVRKRKMGKLTTLINALVEEEAERLNVKL